MTELHALLFCLSRSKKFFQFQNTFLEYLEKTSNLSFDSVREFLNNNDKFIWDEVVLDVNYKKLLETKGQFNYLIYGQTNYPEEFYLLSDPPLILTYMGSEAWLNSTKLTVVGSRNPTEKSVHWMSLELPQLLSKFSWVTVSGGAIGVDQWIHEISLRSKRKTIAILPSGLNEIYPLSLKKMTPAILENGGCLISEFFPYEEVRKYHFKFRNRLIAALNQSCLVIEAKEKSGSLITGHFVLEMGKNLFVLPGHPLDSNFKGSHELLKLGATVLTCHDDFQNFI